MDMPTRKTGTVMFAFTLTEPWPQDRHSTIFRQQIDGGFIDFVAASWSQIHAMLVYQRDDAKFPVQFEVFSCPLAITGKPTLIISVEWVDESVSLYVNGRLVGSTNPFLLIPATLKLEEHAVSVVPGSFEDFSAVNLKKIDIRKRGYEKYLNRPRKRERVRADIEHLFTQLVAEERQIADLLRHVREGGLHHVPGLAARLRLTILEGAPLPLLQLCAAKYDLPLIVHTSNLPTQKLSQDISMYFTGNISGPPNHIFLNPVDLDRWLEFVGVVIGAKQYTNSKVLIDIGNTLGAHVDPDIAATVSTMRTMTVAQTARTAPIDGLGKYVERVAEAVLPLFEQIRLAHEAATRPAPLSG